MSNTCANLLHIIGPTAERDRFVGGIVRAGGTAALLRAHVERTELLPSARETLGTRGLKADPEPTHTNEATAIRFRTHWSPPVGWLKLVCPRFRALTFELLCGSLEGAYVGYLRIEGGRTVVEEFVDDSKAGPFCERHGWPGWWTPLDVSPEPEDLLPSASDFDHPDCDVVLAPGILPTSLVFECPPEGDEPASTHDDAAPRQRW